MAEGMAEAPAIGIDLGTTYSVVGVYRNGRVEIIANEDGNRTTPSYVAFKGNERLIGDAAKDQVALNPFNTVFDAKRLIGRKFDDPFVQADMKHWPFVVISEEGKPKIQITYNDDKKSFFPEEISAMVLGKMRDTAESFLGKKVKKVVVTVPAYFNDAQRQATKDSAAIAGMEILRIINEPTAAAIAYGLDNKSSDKRNVLVFDLGGGTFDVSIMTIDKSNYQVKSTAGDTHLGGEDFDNRLVDHFVQEFKRKHKKDLSTDKRALRRLRNACERAKRLLSSTLKANIALELLFDGIDFYSTISRDRFEDLNADLFRSTIETVEKAITDAKLSKESIHDIVLVGGSTRIPKVQKLLQDCFNGKELVKSINLDEAVAYGAAIQAAILNGDTLAGVKDILFFDVTPLSLGTEVLGDIMSTIIPRNSAVPISATKSYFTVHDNQTRVKVQVYEGERTMIKDNNLLGEFVLEEIPPEPRGFQSHDVTFSVDVNGILNVSAISKSVNNEVKITITNDKNRFSKKAIEQMVAEAEKFRLEDQKQLETAEARFALDLYCYKMKKKVENVNMNDLISDFEKKLILEKCSEEILKLEGNWGLSDKKEEYERRQKEVEDICDPIIAKLGK